MVSITMRFNSWDEFYRIRELLKPLSPKIGTVKKREYYQSVKFTLYNIPCRETTVTNNDAIEPCKDAGDSK